MAGIVIARYSVATYLKHFTTTLLASAFSASVADSAGLLTFYGTAVDDTDSLRARENSAERHAARRPMLTPTVTNGGAARIAVPN
jgi:hypothetical protein